MAKKKTKKKTARKTRGQAKKQPEVLLFVLCDAVSRDPNTGKTSIYGIFDKIWTEKFPSSIALMSIFLRLKDASGKHTVEVEVIDPKGVKLEGNGAVAEINCPPNAILEMNIQLAGVPLKKRGSYKITLKVDNRRVGKPYEIQVEKRKKDKKK